MAYRLIGNIAVTPEAKQVALFLCDTEDDVAEIPTDNLESGTIALIADGHTFQIFNNGGEWK